MAKTAEREKWDESLTPSGDRLRRRGDEIPAAPRERTGRVVYDVEARRDIELLIRVGDDPPRRVQFLSAAGLKPDERLHLFLTTAAGVAQPRSPD